MAAPDWATAGPRLKISPRAHGRNADWNDRLGRWKVAEEYAADSLNAADVEAKVACPISGCDAPAGQPCNDARGAPMPGSPHPERRFAAGAAMIKEGWEL